MSDLKIFTNNIEEEAVNQINKSVMSWWIYFGE